MTTTRPAADALVVGAPLAGRVAMLADVPDPVFAQEMVGSGVALEPLVDAGTGTCEVVAPVAGVVGSVFPHAFAIEAAGGRTVLVHLGIDTVRLDGEGFDLRVGAGDTVVPGQLLVVWCPADVAARGLATVCPVVALQGEPGTVSVLVPPGRDVSAGEPLLTWQDPAPPAPA